MVTLREPCYEDKEIDSCGNSTIATLEVNNIVITLCEECLRDLKHDLDNYLSRQFCGKCKYFGPSESGGLHYGGSCLVSNKVDPKHYGYVNPVDYFSECRIGKFEPNEDNGGNE